LEFGGEEAHGQAFPGDAMAPPPDLDAHHLLEAFDPIAEDLGLKTA
jgi:hypothetical protein